MPHNPAANEAIASVTIVDCTYAQHARAILDILNDAILNSTALYDYQPRTLDSMMRWFELKAAHHFPVIGAVDGSGHFLGFASYGTFRDRPAYKYTMEHPCTSRRSSAGGASGAC
jgi:phosphinothricin acetyltransferase